MNQAIHAANRSLVVKLGVIVLAMFGFGFALVPFYEQICRVTGLREIDSADIVKNTQIDYARNVRIEFDANVRKLPWQFRSTETLRTIHPGEVTQVVYEIANLSDHRMIGQAIPSYGPQQAAQYFRKLECFCFTRQVLEPGERRLMPVVFVIDPGLPKDIATITLSYTFFEVEDGRGG
ncbi:MAG: cytochrome c oxidase assembly protein [Pseudomonadota bacterium]|nr:cytochrome c oxidase assembly protein [Pseudomonadota bacterium]